MAIKIKKKRQTSKGGATVEPGKVIHASDATFDSLVRGTDEPVLVDFWAEWCGPCRRIGPVVDQLAGEYQGRARMVKVNVDQCQRVAQQFQVRSIPTLMLFKGGNVRQTFVGVQPREALVSAIDGMLAA